MESTVIGRPAGKSGFQQQETRLLIPEFRYVFILGSSFFFFKKKKAICHKIGDVKRERIGVGLSFHLLERGWWAIGSHACPLNPFTQNNYPLGNLNLQSPLELVDDLQRASIWEMMRKLEPAQDVPWKEQNYLLGSQLQPLWSVCFAETSQQLHPTLG